MCIHPLAHEHVLIYNLGKLIVILLFQLAYTGFEPFPSADVLRSMYEKHFKVLQEAHEKREKQEKEYQDTKKIKVKGPATLIKIQNHDIESADQINLAESTSVEFTLFVRFMQGFHFKPDISIFCLCAKHISLFQCKYLTNEVTDICQQVPLTAAFRPVC